MTVTTPKWFVSTLSISDGCQILEGDAFANKGVGRAETPAFAAAIVAAHNTVVLAEFQQATPANWFSDGCQILEGDGYTNKVVARAETAESAADIVAAHNALAEQERAPTADEAEGMAWRNAISERERAKWLDKAGTAMPAVAWAEFQRANGKFVPQ
jgi:hypothetical protein